MEKSSVRKLPTKIYCRKSNNCNGRVDFAHQNGRKFAMLPKIKPIRGQMISFHTAKRLFTRVIYSPRGYIVPRKMGKILAGATVEDVGFEKNITESGIESVRENALEISPSLAGLPIR